MDHPSGETDLAQILATLEPVVVDGEFVFIPLSDRADVETLATIVEAEAVTHVVRRAVADERGWPYDFVAGWITLRVHSSLAAVGLTAAASGALAEQGISCNLLAGYYHDHILVRIDDVDLAMAALRRLSSGK
jgi:hypothetical protein